MASNPIVNMFKVKEIRTVIIVYVKAVAVVVPDGIDPVLGYYAAVC